MRARRLAAGGALAVLSGSCTTLLGAQDPIEVFSTPEGGAEGGDGAADADAGDLPAYRSGSRLRARLMKADGVALFVGWHDKGPHDVDCAYATADDGHTRCLPTGADVMSFDGYYADANCTVPVALAPSPGNCAPQRFVVGTVGAAGSCATSVWQAGAAMPPPGEVFENFGAGPCTVVSPRPSSVYPLTPIPATQFVAATSTRRSRGSGLAMDWLQGEDGSLQTSGLFDAKRNAACGPNARLPPGIDALFPGRCVPDDLAWIIDIYADPSCSVQAAWGLPATECAPAPTAVIFAPGNGSPSSPMGCSPQAPWLAQIGSPITTMLYGNNGSTCVPIDNGSATAYAVGARIAPDSLPPLVAQDEGSGRIQLAMLTTEAGVPLFATTLFDSQFGGECAATFTSDGVLRCIPTSPAYFDPVYLDSTCTMALAQIDGGCSPPSLLYTNPPTAGSCYPAYGTEAIYQVGALEEPSTTYTNSGGPCTPQPASSGSQFYEASPLPPTEFAPVQPVTE